MVVVSLAVSGTTHSITICYRGSVISHQQPMSIKWITYKDIRDNGGSIEVKSPTGDERSVAYHCYLTQQPSSMVIDIKRTVHSLGTIGSIMAGRRGQTL